MRDLSAAHAEAFLEMMSAERGAAKNTLISYEKDLDELAAFLRTRNVSLASAASADLQAFLVSENEKWKKVITDAGITLQ